LNESDIGKEKLIDDLIRDTRQEMIDEMERRTFNDCMDIIQSEKSPSLNARGSSLETKGPSSANQNIEGSISLTELLKKYVPED
jgi:hypothetical protein